MDPLLIALILTAASGVCGLFARYAFRSKCNHLNCCFGLCIIDRNVTAELEEEKMELEHGVPQDNGTELASIVGSKPK